MQDLAAKLSARVRSESERNEDRVAACYERLFGRRVSPGELRIALEFLGKGDSDARWKLLCHTLLASPELLFTP